MKQEEGSREIALVLWFLQVVCLPYNYSHDVGMHSAFQRYCILQRYCGVQVVERKDPTRDPLNYFSQVSRSNVSLFPLPPRH